MNEQNTILIVVVALLVLSWIGFIISIERIRTNTKESCQRDAHANAQQMLAKWRQDELERMRATEADLARSRASSELTTWKQQEEASIRSDAILRSQSVIMGKITEHLIPFTAGFPYDHATHDSSGVQLI